jgi:hypothetical protein
MFGRDAENAAQSRLHRRVEVLFVKALKTAASTQ